MSFWSYTEQNTMVLFDINKKVGLANSCWTESMLVSSAGNLLGYCYGGHLESKIDVFQVVRDEREALLPAKCPKGMNPARFICRWCKICNMASFVCRSGRVSRDPAVSSAVNHMLSGNK